MRDPLAMTDAELQILRETLGLTVPALAKAIGIATTTVERWESGRYPISRANADALRDLVAYTDRAVADLVDAHVPGEPVVTYPTDTAYRNSRPELILSAAWHRQVARRVSDQTDARIVYEA